MSTVRTESRLAMAPARDSLWVVALRSTMMASTAGVLVWPLAPTLAAVYAGVGAALACLVASWFEQRRHFWSKAIAGVALVVAAAGISWQMVAHVGLSASFSPEAMAHWADCVRFGLGACGLALLLRSLAQRWRAASILELAVVALAFAHALRAHRQGAIHRPFEIADPILASGADPTIFFLLAGAAAALIGALLLLREARWQRLLLHLGALLLLGLFGWLGVRLFGWPTAPPVGSDGLGLRAKGEKTPREGQTGGRKTDDRPKEQLEFRDNYDRETRRIPIGVVLFHDDYSPPSGVYYFRQTAFSQFNGQRLVAATRDDVDGDIADGFPTQTSMLAETPPLGKLRRELHTTVALLADHARPFAVEAVSQLSPSPIPSKGHFKRAYRAVSRTLDVGFGELIGRRAGAATWQRPQWQHYTQLPSDERYGALARRVVEEVLPEHLRRDPLAIALAFSSWLSRHGTYSLRSRHSETVDPTAHFLFGDKVGYCVHFAHAMTYLLRAMQLPARVATGYAIEESARQGGSALLLSGQDSHAWAELYLEGAGWIAVDVVPQTVLDPPPTPPDPELQRLLADMARNTPPANQAMQQKIANLGHSLRSALRWLAIGGGILAGLAWAFGLLSKLWRRTAPRWSRAEAQPRLLYRAALDQLSELRLQRRHGESREAFARRIAAWAPSFDALTSLHLAAAFGVRHTVPASSLQQTKRQVSSDLRHAFPWWKRLWGAMLPWSWLRSR